MAGVPGLNNNLLAEAVDVTASDDTNIVRHIENDAAPAK